MTPTDLNSLFLSEYGEDVANYRIQRAMELDTSNPLEDHKLDIEIRSLMVNWIVNAAERFKCMELTIFKSVSILDLYSKKIKAIQDPIDYKIIGIISFYIGAKYIEKWIPLNSLLEYVKKQKFTKEVNLTPKEAMDIEVKIVFSLAHLIDSFTIYDLVEILMVNFLHGKEFDDIQTRINKSIMKYSFYLSILVCFDYKATQRNRFFVAVGILNTASIMTSKKLKVKVEIDSQIHVIKFCYRNGMTPT